MLIGSIIRGIRVYNLFVGVIEVWLCKVMGLFRVLNDKLKSCFVVGYFEG